MRNPYSSMSRDSLLGICHAAIIRTSHLIRNTSECVFTGRQMKIIHFLDARYLHKKTHCSYLAKQWIWYFPTIHGSTKSLSTEVLKVLIKLLKQYIYRNICWNENWEKRVVHARFISFTSQYTSIYPFSNRWNIFGCFCFLPIIRFSSLHEGQWVIWTWNHS